MLCEFHAPGKLLLNPQKAGLCPLSESDLIPRPCRGGGGSSSAGLCCITPELVLKPWNHEFLEKKDCVLLVFTSLGWGHSLGHIKDT